jgi:hypothetical protein
MPAIGLGDIGLWDVEVSTFSRQWALRWWWGCQPYAPAGGILPPPHKIPDTHFPYRLSRPQGLVRLEGLGQTKKSNDLVGNRTQDHPACSITLLSVCLFHDSYQFRESSWLQIQRSGFDSRNYQNFWEAVGLERGALSLVSAIEELLGRKK